MKRGLHIGLACLLALSLVSCAKTPADPQTEAPATTTTGEITTATEGVTTSTEETTTTTTTVASTTTTTTTKKPTTTTTVPEEAAELTAIRKEIKAAGKLFGVAYLGGFDGTDQEAKTELFGQDYVDKMDFVRSITDYVALDGWQMYCVVPVDDSVTLTISEYVFADEPYVGKELRTTNKPILLRGNVSEIVPNLHVKAVKGSKKVEYTPQQSGMDGKLVSDDKVYDFTPYEYMAQFGGVDRLPDAVFCGDWWTEVIGGDGEERSLCLTIFPDGRVEYGYGIGNSEILEWFEGEWHLDKKDRLCLEMTGGPEGGKTYSCNLVFEWEITAEGLSLKHVAGDAILYGTNGDTFDFESAVG